MMNHLRSRRIQSLHKPVSPKSSSSESSTFGLQTKDQIDKTFNKFCQRFRTSHLSFARKSTRIDDYPEDRIKTSNTNEISIFPVDCLKLIKECYNKKAKDSNHVKICKKVKNPIVGSLLEGLILWSIQSVKNAHQQQSVNELNVAQTFIANHNILKQFDIPKVRFDLVRKPEDKIQFIQDSMKQNIEKSLDQFQRLMIERQKQQLKFEDSYLLQKNELEKQKQKADVFNEQILIKSRFQAIKAKLWKAISSKLGEYENQILTHSAIENETKVKTLNNFEGISTSDVLYSEFAQFGQLAREIHHSQFKSRKSRSMDEPKFQTSVEWTKENEENFLMKQRMGKKLFLDICNNKNVNRIGLLEPIYQNIKDDTKNRQRDVLMQRYISDEFLNQDEMKFLHDTCELINKNIDKEFEKKKLKSLDDDLINQIELSVVQEVIQRFVQLRQEYMKARKEYLQKIRNQRLIIYRQQQEKKKEIIQNLQKKKNLYRKSDLYRYKLDSMLEQKQFKNVNVQIYVQIFVENLKKKVEDTRKKKTMQELLKVFNQEMIEFRKSQETQPGKISWQEYLDKKQMNRQKVASKDMRLKKNKYHPASKLLIADQNKLKEDYALEKRRFVQLLKNAQIFYENTYGQDSQFKISNRFIKFYTGGPSDQVDYKEQLQNQEALAILNKCATKIQKVWRSFQLRKHFNERIQQQHQHFKNQALNTIKQLHYIISNRSPDITNKKLRSTTISDSSPFNRKKRYADIFRQNRSRKLRSNHRTSPNSLLKRMYDGKTSEPSIKLQLTSQKELKYQNDQVMKDRQPIISTRFVDKLTQRQLLLQKLRSLFRMAKHHKNEEIFESQKIVLNGNEVNMLDNNGFSALYYSCKRGCLQVSKYLSDILGADINLICRDGNTPLHVGMRMEMNQIIIQFLIRRILSFISCRKMRDNLTPLGMCRTEILKSLGLSDKVVVCVQNEKNYKFDNNIIIKGIKLTEEFHQKSSELIFKPEQMTEATNQIRTSQDDIIKLSAFIKE